MKRISLKEVYKDFGLRYDLREARKLLDLPKNTPRKVINNTLREFHYSIQDEIEEKPVYQYILNGLTRQSYLTKDGLDKLAKPEHISISFQSKTKYNLHKINLISKGDMPISNFMLNNDFPIIHQDSELAPIYLGNDSIVDAWAKLGSGSNFKVNTLTNVSRRKLPKRKKQLKDVKMFNASIQLPYKEFKGFQDTGNNKCVPETLLHHLQLNDRHKKLKLQDVINNLEGNYEDEEDLIEVEEIEYEGKKYYKDENIILCQKTHSIIGVLETSNIIRWLDLRYNETELEGEYEDPTEDDDTRGYTAQDIIDTLASYKCKARLLDINKKQFLTSNTDLKVNKHLNVFCGIVYNNHLYYCDDKSFVQTLGQKMKEQATGFKEQTYEKVKAEKEINYDIKETNDLIEYYKEQFNKDKTIRLVKTENGRITRINYEDKVICANPDKTIMEEILGPNFNNMNLTILGEKEFNEFFPNHKCSSFTKEVFDELSKRTGIVETFNEPKLNKQDEYDINKCRTDCWLNNRLGSYEVFGVSAQPEPFDNKIKKGIYYIEVDFFSRTSFFFEGSGWYSGDYILFGLSEGFQANIKYQILATDTLPANHFKPFAQKIVSKYPNHFKKIINSCIGYRGKTVSKVRRGYVETDFEMAVSAFWDNNDEKIGFLYDENIDKKIWKTMKGKMCNINSFKVDENTNHYIVETTDYKTLYENDLPIYNKVVENEYIRIYELKKALLQNTKARLIKIKTDAIIVEGKVNKIKLSDTIGGYKHQQIEIKDFNIKEPKEATQYELKTDVTWKVILEDDLIIPTSSYLITGLAGFGKSYLAKQQPEYDDENTIRLAFTNVSSENLADENHITNTLNSYFGIDFTNGKCSEKKLKNLKNVKCIMITEVFMIPSYIMGHLIKIKNEFPHIKFICEGDPEQTRPVKEEHINWLETQLLHKLCDGIQIKLTKNKRNNETANYHKIFENKPLDESKYKFREPQKVNICRTNAMRVTINHLMMEKEGYFIEKSKSNSKSQDIWIKTDTPIMCVKNDKKMGLKNGKMYTIDEIGNNQIKIQEHTFTDIQFAEYFVVAFAYTNHKVQGITIKEPFNIYEWKKMVIREKYTAYSRTSDGSNVQIVNNQEVNWTLWEELQKFFCYNYVIYKWSNIHCNDIYVGHTNNFEKRKQEHIKSCLNSKTKNHYCKIYQFIRASGGIENWEMEILEEFYAGSRKEAEQVEQKWIDNLKPTLNMCRASK